MNLRNLNLVAAVFHSAVLISVAVIWATAGPFGDKPGSVRSDTFTVQVMDNELTTVENVGNARSAVLYIIVAFLGLTALGHFMAFGLKTYTGNVLTNKTNPLRWGEYAVTCTCMLVILFYTVSQKQLDVIVLSCVVNVFVMLMGLLVERLMADGQRPNAVMTTVFAWGLYGGMLFTLVRAFANTYRHNDVPDFVPAVFGTTLVLFLSFGVVQALYVGGAITFEQGEYSYMALSFTSKALLAYIVTMGVVSR